MKIGDFYTRAVSGNLRVRRRGGVDGVSETSAVGGADQVELSGRGLEVQRARILALEAPDVRENLVAELRREIERGSYGAPATQVLDKIVRDHAELRLPPAGAYGFSP